MSWAPLVAALPHWEPGPPGHASLVVAHPDDESLALTATVCALLARRWSVDLTCLTAGERALPGLPDDAARRMAALRRAELASAWAVLADDAPLTVVGLPDSGLDGDPDAVAASVDRATADADLLVSLWDGDPHPDHAATGRAVLAAAAGRPVALAPVWARVWFTPAHPQIPWDRCRRVVADEDVRGRRRRALAEHRSQLVGFEEHPAVVDHEDREAFLADDVLVVSSGVVGTTGAAA